jgi:tetratricopeptide (TPR) repeat protein
MRTAERVLALSTRAPRRSLSLARRAIAGSGRLEPALRARLLRVYGHALRASGEYTAARTAYRDARRLYRRAGLETDHAIAALGLIDACMYLGSTTEALKVADEARTVFLRVKDVLRLAMLETNVGNVHHQGEDLLRALEHYDRAARLLASVGTPVQVASLDHNRANALTHLGRREEAEVLYRNSLAAFESAGEQVLAAQVRYGLACLHFLHGEYAAAIIELEEVRPQLQRLGARPLLALADLDLAEVLVAMRLHAEARVLARSARSWFRARGIAAQEARCLLVLAVAGAGMGLEREARHAAAEADRLFGQLRHAPGGALADLIRCQLDLAGGRSRAAAAGAMSARRTFQAAGFPNRALAAGALAVEAMLRTRQWARARKLARAFAHAPTRAGDAFSRMRLLRAEGVACAEMGDIAAALSAYREAIQHSKDVHASQFVDEWRVGFLGGELALLDESLGILLERRPRPRANEIRAWIALATKAGQHGGSAPAECSPVVARQIARLRGELEACFAHLWRVNGVAEAPVRTIAGHRLERRAEALESRLRRLAGARVRPVASRTTRHAVGSRSPGPNEVILTYFSAAGRLGALRQGPDGSRVFPDLAPMSELERHVQLLHHQMDLRASQLPTMAAHDTELRARSRRHLDVLGRMILDPVLSPDRAIRRIVIAPWGPLFRIPFHALHWRGAPLTAVSEVSVALTPQVAPASPGGTREGAWVIAFDPKGDSAIQEEARTVAAALAKGGTKVQLRLGSEADRAAIEQAAREAELIHLAGHAVYRAMHPEFSALRVADGCVNVRDFAALDLRGALVVLSACETGPRAVGATHESLGLVRGLTRAGARTILASLWRVDDRATLDEMRALYEGWPRAGRLGRTWREAQLRSAIASQDPFLWAAFTLFGDPDAPWPGAFDGMADSDTLDRHAAP